MLKSAPPPPAQAAAKPRPKPRPKKPAAAADGAEDGDDAAARQKAKRRYRLSTLVCSMCRLSDRRAAQKRREQATAASEAAQQEGNKTRTEMTELPLGPDSLHLMQHLHEGQRYDRVPRLLPEIAGVKSLSATEAQGDVKSIQQALAVFEARAGIKLPDGAPAVGDPEHRRLLLLDDNDDDEDVAPLSGLLKNRRARANGVIAPEEIVESLPACRRAVRITQRELRAMKIEREDLEREFVRHRCTLVWQVGEMKRMQKQQERVQRALSRDVVRKAKSLESSRRRTSALQDIMTELEARGSSIVRLTREKRQLETLLEAQSIDLPEIEEVCVGDRVVCGSFGRGRVLELRVDSRQIVAQLDVGGRAYVQEEVVEVLPSDTTYVEAEQQLKQRFFEKIAALVQPNGKLQMLSGAVAFAQEDEDEDDDSDEDASDSSEEETSTLGGDTKVAGNGEDATQRRAKKRRLIMTAPSGAESKKAKTRRLIEFPASTIPITPFDAGLLISPLSELPERVAAVGPNALQWLPSYLPKNMDEWEQERFESLQMKGELERLRFQLQKAEGMCDTRSIGMDRGVSLTAERVPFALAGSSKSHKANHHGKASNSHHKKDAKRPRDDSGDELSETNSKSSKGDDDAGDEKKATKGQASDDHENADDEAGGEEESSDAASSQPTTRSLRPRRKARSSSTTASPKPSK
ncbi:hypothetical protein BBJ28_00021242 [Nothophytophthora sp. Chile5]|nr:hypothetical protein BBJ28_00021242 [Nothophytophthora sp. Chile5]